MPLLSESAVSLRFLGDDLDPDAITTALGEAPTKLRQKGEAVRGGVTGKVVVPRTSAWVFSVEGRSPADLDSQVDEIFRALTADLATWRRLSAAHGGELFCGLFMAVSNEGVALSAPTIQTIAERGLRLDFDIYAADEDG